MFSIIELTLLASFGILMLVFEGLASPWSFSFITDEHTPAVGPSTLIMRGVKR